MTVMVKNGLCKKLFVDETGKKLAVLQSTGLFSPEKAVIGPDKMVKYETFIESFPDKPTGKNRRYILKRGDVLMATAMPMYAANADHFAIPKPPRPVGMEIHLQDGAKWWVRRGKGVSVDIWTPDGTGRLSDLLFICSQKYDFPEGSDLFLWVGVYGMIDYMMCEDDTYPV